jgi:hypothetical protein
LIYFLWYCINECIFRARFANIAANAYTPYPSLHHVIHLCLDMSCSYWFHFCAIHACTVSFVHMRFKKMSQFWIYIQSLSRSYSVRSLVESGYIYQQWHGICMVYFCSLGIFYCNLAFLWPMCAH